MQFLIKMAGFQIVKLVIKDIIFQTYQKGKRTGLKYANNTNRWKLCRN